MGKVSSIQWTDATWNVAVGCTKVDEDCKFCYMYRDSLDGTRFDPKKVRKTKTVFNLPLKLKEPSRIFTSSYTDVFHEEVDAFRDDMWDIIRKCPQHIFQILTKRPERINQCLPPDWGDGWDNVWLGTSVGSQDSIDRIVSMVKVDTKVRFLSLEPLHGPIDLRNITVKVKFQGYEEDFHVLPAFDWVIVGGESGNENGKYRYRPCELQWIEKIVKDCTDNNIPVFVKQLGTHLSKQMSLADRHGGDIDEFPYHLKTRQFPNHIKP
jgi:protein gp37